MGKLKIKTLQKQVDQLAKELECVVIQKPGMAGMMYVEEEPPRIEGPTLEGFKTYGPEVSYMVMLHELGHVYHGHTQGRPPYHNKTFYFDNGVLKSEAQAWEWALDNRIIEDLEDATRKFMWEVCLGSYYAGSVHAGGKPTKLYNGNRHYVKFVFDEPDEFFWSIKRRILEGD